VKRFNLLGEEWERERERPGYRSRSAPVGRHVGGERIGATLYELDPGEKTFPYHLHHANEEWLVVVRGRPTLRTPEGERELREGDTVCFTRGPEGAHQVHNRSDASARVLVLSTRIGPDVAEYPDSEKIGVWGRGFGAMFPRSATADYWDGE
jgi:uncharacterized cupin superfamily protein